MDAGMTDLPQPNIYPDARKRTDVGFWDALGIGETGLPIHMPMGVNSKGQGPADVQGQVPFRYTCWCGDEACPLSVALAQARRCAVKNIKISGSTQEAD